MKIPMMTANSIDSDEVLFGGACKFYDPKRKESVVLFLHADQEGKPMVTKVRPESVKITEIEERSDAKD